MSVQKNNNIILRNHLMQLMDSLSQKRIVYVYAPAGYGKTVFVNQWLTQYDKVQAMISLDEYDNNIGSFCRRICTALISYQPNNISMHEIVSHPYFESAPDEFTIRAMDALPRDLEACLAIDDLHLIQNIEILRFLPIFLNRLPENVHVIILSRNAPPTNFSSFILKNTLSMINSEQLRFKKNEIITLFQKHELILTMKQAGEIFTFTDGWAIGLNALILSGKEPSGQRLVMNHLETFIKTQVFVRWDETIRNFMLRTSIVEDLTPSLCVALTGESASAEILVKLVEENAFLLEMKEKSYRFHQLFRTVLLHMFIEKGEAELIEVQRRAGEWYLSQRDFYKATEMFLKSGDEEGFARCFSLLEEVERNGFIIDKILPIMEMHVDESVMMKYPALLCFKSWAAFNEGRPKDMMDYLDQFYMRLPDIIRQDPNQALFYMFLRCLDFRVTMRELELEVRNMPIRPLMKPDAGTMTQNMTLFHRSSRDFSEYADGFMVESLWRLKTTIGDLFGKEQDLFEACLIAGLKYEQGNLIDAYQYALSANTGIDESFAPESKFCARMILVCIFDAQQQFDQAQIILDQVAEMIERDMAYYLNYNFSAFLYKRKLWDGDMAAAERWLEEHGTNPYEDLVFYKLYGHFTTARAYITKGHYDTAIVILTKLVKLCETYRRPLDVIEGQVLLSIAYWKKKRGFQAEAVKYLEQAIIAAQHYGYIQVFINEGSELTNMLYRIQSRAMRQNYEGEIQGNYAKRLYLQSLQEENRKRGLTNGQIPKSIKFTEKQRTVMGLLCEGMSYRQIAECMGIKFSTVRSHIELIYKKLDVPNETAAIIRIQELGILNDE